MQVEGVQGGQHQPDGPALRRRPAAIDFLLPEVRVHLAGGDPSERCPDFVVVRRGYCGRESTISRGGAVIAQIKPMRHFRWLGYNVSINAGVDYAFILALAVILEAISRRRY